MTEAAIPLADPRAAYREHKADFDAAIERVLESNSYILGAEVQAFERELAASIGVSDAVGVGNGTDALVLALMGLGIGPGDLVATVAHTAVPTVAAIFQTGAQPLLVDVDQYGNLDPAHLAAAVMADKERRIRAVVPVHLYGQMADMPRILEIAVAHGAVVVEDCAQAQGASMHGRPAGSWGDAAAFSFYPTKNLGAFGDGGAIATDKPDLAERLRALRQYGWKDRLVVMPGGQNSRLDEVQAAILRIKLAHLEADNDRRRALADIYAARLPREVAPPCRENTRHVYHLYVVTCPDRAETQRVLAAAGIGTAVHYALPVHKHPGYNGLVALAPGGLPRTEALASRILSLPMYPQLKAAYAEQVAEAVRRSLGL
ncbi:DegT/DnrJ/EryC1/StrS family aminotransferase [Novispirillum sp. DQ9]|uniref:DegT/DnrJ/EryC1/StrS family aminotransferase n=1 Tax=Novispirillum sp. DQ9 TaxID=3398612 RepID=UPI003C7A398C